MMTLKMLLLPCFTIVAFGATGAAALPSTIKTRKADSKSSKADSSSARAPPNFVELTSLGSGAQEVPPVATNTLARAHVAFDPFFTGMKFDVDVFTENSSTRITQAHLHCGSPGVNGPVVAFLFGLVEGGVSVNGDLAAGILTANDIIADTNFAADPACGVAITTIASLYQLIVEGKLYVNIHSVAFPAGEVRAQVFLNP